MSWFPVMTGPPWYSIVWSVRAAVAGNELTAARTSASVMQRRASFDPMVVSSSQQSLSNWRSAEELGLAQNGLEHGARRLSDRLRIRERGPRYHSAIAFSPEASCQSR